MIRAAIIFFILVAGVSAAELNVPRLVDGLRQVENYRGRDGTSGERGPWQLMPATWRQHMPGVPFDQARREGPARECATRHVVWLRRSLRAAGWPDSVYNVALAWNAGLERTLAGRAPAASRNFAERVANLYRQQ